VPRAFFRDGTKPRAVEWIDYERLRHLVPLSLIISHYGLDAELKRVGSSLHGCCPVHKGSNPVQFVVDLQKGVWRCFGDCNRGGGSLELVAEIEHLALRDAAILIARRFGVARQDRVRGHSHQQKGHQAMSGKPSHKVFVVEDKEVAEGADPEAFWTRIGSAWPHKDGKGLNLVLSALPINGRLVLREYTPEDEKKDEEKKVAKFRKK
jgi:CHC2 zinc finger